MFKRCLLVIILLVVLLGDSTPTQAVDLDDSLTHAWEMVTEHGEVRVDNKHGTLMVWQDNKLKITRRTFADGTLLLTVRWKGKIVTTQWLPTGPTPIRILGEWQEWLLQAWCEYHPTHADCT